MHKKAQWFMSTDTSKSSFKSRKDDDKDKFIKHLSSMKPEDVLPEKNKRAAENLRKAGLIK